jgi:hypothetical protein
MRVMVSMSKVLREKMVNLMRKRKTSSHHQKRTLQRKRMILRVILRSLIKSQQKLKRPPNKKAKRGLEMVNPKNQHLQRRSKSLKKRKKKMNRSLKLKHSLKRRKRKARRAMMAARR